MAEKYAIILFTIYESIACAVVLRFGGTSLRCSSKIPAKIEKHGNGRRNGAFLHISIKTASNCRRFGVRQFNRSKSAEGTKNVVSAIKIHESNRSARTGAPNIIEGQHRIRLPEGRCPGV